MNTHERSRQRSDLRARVLAGEAVVGCMISYDSPWLIEMAALAGFDFATVDLEHEPLSHAALAGLVRAADAYGLPVVARTQCDDRLQRVLNLGVAGVQIPNIETPDGARDVVRTCRFHPHGQRGYTLSTRDANYGLVADRAGYMREANDNLLVIAMLESAEAVEQVESIVAVDGIDAFHIGPGDLGQSLGYPGAETVDRAIGQLAAAVRGSGKALCLGTYVNWQPEQVREQWDLGVRVFTVVLNRLLMQHLANVRSEFGDSLTGLERPAGNLD